jgi:hypothetical protein
VAEPIPERHVCQAHRDRPVTDPAAQVLIAEARKERAKPRQGRLVALDIATVHHTPRVVTDRQVLPTLPDAVLLAGDHPACTRAMPRGMVPQ